MTPGSGRTRAEADKALQDAIDQYGEDDGSQDSKNDMLSRHGDEKKGKRIEKTTS